MRRHRRSGPCAVVRVTFTSGQPRCYRHHHNVHGRKAASANSPGAPTRGRRPCPTGWCGASTATSALTADRRASRSSPPGVKAEASVMPRPQRHSCGRPTRRGGDVRLNVLPGLRATVAPLPGHQPPRIRLIAGPFAFTVDPDETARTGRAIRRSGRTDTPRRHLKQPTTRGPPITRGWRDGQNSEGGLTRASVVDGDLLEPGYGFNDALSGLRSSPSEDAPPPG